MLGYVQPALSAPDESLSSPGWGLHGPFESQLYVSCNLQACCGVLMEQLFYTREHLQWRRLILSGCCVEYHQFVAVTQ